MILRSDLPLPTGRATAESLCEIFARGQQAAIKLRVLLGRTLLAGLLKWLDSAGWDNLPQPGPALC